MHQGRSLIFSVLTERSRLISILLYDIQFCQAEIIYSTHPGSARAYDQTKPDRSRTNENARSIFAII